MKGLSLSQNARLALAAYIVVEAFLYLLYQHNDFRFHWFIHFFVGGSVALVLMATIAYRSQRPVPLPLLWLLIGHIFAAFPDILFNFGGISHSGWMDIFALHISSHFVPGRIFTWYAVFMASLAIYLWFLFLIEIDSVRRFEE